MPQSNASATPHVHAKLSSVMRDHVISNFRGARLGVVVGGEAVLGVVGQLDRLILRLELEDGDLRQRRGRGPLCITDKGINLAVTQRPAPRAGSNGPHARRYASQWHSQNVREDAQKCDKRREDAQKSNPERQKKSINVTRKGRRRAGLTAGPKVSSRKIFMSMVASRSTVGS